MAYAMNFGSHCGTESSTREDGETVNITPVARQDDDQDPAPDTTDAGLPIRIPDPPTTGGEHHPLWH